MGGDAENMWLNEQKRFLSEVKSMIDFYDVKTKKLLHRQRFLTVASMILGVLAPVFVTASGTTEADFFGLPATQISGCAIVLTLTLSVLEGVRRIFRYEQRWVGSHSAMMSLRSALDKFRFSIVDAEPGGPEWKRAMVKLRTTYETETTRERSAYYVSMTSLDPQDTQKNSEQQSPA